MKYIVALCLWFLPLRSFSSPVLCSYVGPISSFGLLPTKKDPNVMVGLEATLMPCAAPIFGVVMKSQVSQKLRIDTLAAQISLGILGFELGANLSSWGPKYSTHFEVFSGLPYPTSSSSKVYGESTGDRYIFYGVGYKYNDLYSKPTSYFIFGLKVPMSGEVFKMKGFHT